jgi:hypothetical protein
MLNSRLLSEAASCIGLLCLFVAATPTISPASDQASLCLDGFCIGQSIQDARFDKVRWVVPQRGLTKESCNGIGCKPTVAFRGYAPEYQTRLAEAVSWIYGITHYNLVRNDTLEVLRRYKYECNPSARGIWGERRFWGAYLSTPSHYLTVVGLRLIGGELRVYRIARQYPYHHQDELISLARKLHEQYGAEILLYDYLSSNAYYYVIENKKNGWFGRSTMFNPTDLSDNAAELVLIDPSTRLLLEPSSMPESGEIKPLAVELSKNCNISLPLQ